MSRLKEIAVDHSGCDFKRRSRRFTSGFWESRLAGRKAGRF
jgi:hypothetical protein